MAAAAIWNLFESKIAPLDPPSPKPSPPITQHEVDRTTGCGDIAIGNFSKMAAAAILDLFEPNNTTEFLIIGLKQQLSKIDNSSLNTTHSARNLGFIFDEHLTFSDQISSLSKSCYSHIRELRCIRS